MLLAAVVLGAAQMPAGASPVNPASRTDKAPEKAEEEPVPYVPELIDFGLLRDELRAEYKETFAGLVNNGDDTITIYETRPSDELHAWVAERFEKAAEENGIEPKLIPTVTYRTARLSLNELFAMKDSVMASADALARKGVNVEVVGVQDSSNQIIVGVSSPVGKAQDALAQTYATDTWDVIEWKLTEEADRWNDSPPWNGGDQIVSEGSTFTACTTGYGMHDGSGNHYVTTAGHCNTHFWWNTFAGFPIRNNTTLLGVTSGPVWNGVYFGYRVDTQKLITDGSSYFIWTGNSSRRTMSAPLGVAQGDPTCIDGSISLTACGTITATDFGEGDTEYLVDIGEETTAFGDSGAPSWRNSPFGPLAQGTHVGSLSNGMRVELNIFAVMFFNGAVLNTPFDP